MRHVQSFARAAAISALLAVSALSSPALAGKNDRAQEAIAVAKGKIDAADKVGASAEAGGLQMKARDALRNAQALLSDGKKDAAILEAQHSGELADQALVVTDKRKTMAQTGARQDAEAAAASAQQSAAEANQRAASAEQSAATANAEADAARNAPSVVVAAPAPAPTTTTVMTEEKIVHTPARRAHRTVVHHRAKPATTVAQKTTTIVNAPQ